MKKPGKDPVSLEVVNCGDSVRWCVWLSFYCASSKPRLPVSVHVPIHAQWFFQEWTYFWLEKHCFAWMGSRDSWKQPAVKHGSPPIFLPAVQLDSATIFCFKHGITLPKAVGDSVPPFHLKGSWPAAMRGLTLSFYIWVWLLEYGGNEYLAYHSWKACSVFLVV